MKTFLAVLSLSILLVACGAQQPTDINDPFVGGTEGLALSFMQGAPPREIFDAGQMPFSVNLVIDNLGEADVGPESENSDNMFAAAQIIGINPVQFGSPETVKTFDYEGLTVRGGKKNINGDIIKGEQNILTFEGFQYMVDETGSTPITLRANLCYDYETRSNTKVCIKDNVLENIQDNTICTLSGPKDPKNSGAPVHVTGLTQVPLAKNKIQVTFTIENVNDGMIFRRVSDFGGIPEEACDPNNLRERNIVHVRVYTGDDAMTAEIECPLLRNLNEGDVTLFQGTAQTIVCTLETAPNLNRVFTDTLHVDLDYTYLDYVETPILIKDVGIAG